MRRIPSVHVEARTGWAERQQSGRSDRQKPVTSDGVVLGRRYRCDNCGKAWLQSGWRLGSEKDDHFEQVARLGKLPSLPAVGFVTLLGST